MRIYQYSNSGCTRSQDESIFGTKTDKDITISHETYSKIWAHLISDKASRMKIHLDLGKLPKGKKTIGDGVKKDLAIYSNSNLLVSETY